MSEDSRDRLLVKAPGQPSCKKRFVLSADDTLRPCHDCRDAGSGRFGKKNSGFAPGLLDPGKPQLRDGAIQNLLDRGPGHSVSASFAAWSSEISASMISSNASPDITLSIL